MLAALSRLGALVLFVAALSACGDRTGLELHVVPPANFDPGVDFDSLWVQLTVDGTTYGEPAYRISADTDRPYVVYVLQGEAEHHNASVLAQLKKSTEVVGEGRVAGLKIKQGELQKVVVDIAAH